VRTLIVIATAAVFAAGCASRPVNPNAVNIGNGMVVDGTGKDRNLIISDANDCQGIAQATNPEEKVATGAVVGAIAGALLGAVIYRGSGLSGNSGAGYGAALGAISGTGAGASDAAVNLKVVLRNCMLQRGHRVLN
jgi:hypothetical protein